MVALIRHEYRAIRRRTEVPRAVRGVFAEAVGPLCVSVNEIGTKRLIGWLRHILAVPLRTSARERVLYHQQCADHALYRGTRPRIARERVPPAKADSPSLLVCGAGSLAAIVSEHMLQASVPSRLCETAYQDE